MGSNAEVDVNRLFQVMLSRKKSATQSLTSVDAKTVLSESPSKTKTGELRRDTTSAASVNSAHELVAFDDDGHPYIDINKLAYKPRKKHHDHQKERLSWYLPDFSFIIFNIMSLGCSTYFILIGNTTLTWKSSIGMFSLPNCYAIHGLNYTNGTRSISSSLKGKPDDFFFAPCETFLYEKPFWDSVLKQPGEGYNFSVPGSHPILRTKLTDVHYFGLVLICLAFFNALNVCVGINACLQGYTDLLSTHIAVDGFIVLAEFIICAAVHFTGRCEEKDIEIIRVIFQHFIRWYSLVQKGTVKESATEKLLTTEVDSLQIGLGCCGADGWQDYLAAFEKYPMSGLAHSRSESDETETVIPFSCCRPWWVRNLYCAQGAHRWGQPLASPEKALQFHERINQESCIYKLEKMCNKIRSLMGTQGFITTSFHLLFVVVEAAAAFVFVHNINKLIKEKKRMMKQKEIGHEDSVDEFEMLEDSSQKDESLQIKTPGDMMTARVSADSSMTRVTAGTQSFRKSRGYFTKIPPPTEDEILTIKQRTNFNQFIIKVKTSHVGKWMKQAQEAVTTGHDDDDEQLTALEKKAREKELLHKGRNKDDDSDDAFRHRHHHHHNLEKEALAKLEEFAEEKREAELTTPRSSSSKDGKRRMRKLNKVKSKLGAGHIIKKKGRKSVAKFQAKSDANLEASKSHLPDAGQEEKDLHKNMLSAMATKYGKRKSKKSKSKKKLVPIPSTPSLVLLVPKKGHAHKHLKSEKLGNEESTTALLSSEEEMHQPEEEEKKIGKSKKTVHMTPSSELSEWESSSEKGTEGGSEREEEDSEEHARRKRKKRKKSRKKRIRAAKKKREKHKKDGKRPWFAYF
ncbi:hypothetical protein Ocin01_15582 [Orchesella cincta]|uniref:Uncharacterized protein n=1 Tax=Orchesella cincta TaxID=48709 RepID=A0A1D2MDV4_ORCCI|nr:hypothetical protein Ocin01_15582 [Orchesella cincta]